MLYVVDEQGRLIDDIRIREFLLRPLAATVHEIRNQEFYALKVTDLQDAAVELLRKYDRTSLPVVDSARQARGHRDGGRRPRYRGRARDGRHAEDGWFEALDEPYLQIALRKMIRKRAGWLIVLFLGELLTATAMGYFEHEIAKAVVLALFVPLIISSGGNSDRRRPR